MRASLSTLEMIIEHIIKRYTSILFMYLFYLLVVFQQPAVPCCVGLGYHRDPQTRAAFMEVLTKILQQGTEFETLAETVLADRFERLVELVTMIGDKGELPIAMALASVVANPHMVLAVTDSALTAIYIM